MAAPKSSIRSVAVALAGNAFVTLTKFAAFLASGSGAMLSEAIHSVADTGNQVLLFWGLKRASRESDEDFHYGYGGERFVFGMLSASGIFFVGAGVTIYHGIAGLVEPHMPHLTLMTFVVLGLSLLVEGSVLLYAVKLVNAQRGQTPFLKYVREQAEPATLAILLEDSAAVFGLFLAAAGIFASYMTQLPVWDSLASILVGLVLAAVALFIIHENRELLLGKSVPDGVEQQFVEILRSRASIRDVHDVKTRQLTPEAFKFKAEIVFNESFLAEQLERVLPQDGTALSSPARTKTLRELSHSAVNVIAREIDLIEDAIRTAIPQAKHIDLEVHHN